MEPVALNDSGHFQTWCMGHGGCIRIPAEGSYPHQEFQVGYRNVGIALTDPFQQFQSISNTIPCSHALPLGESVLAGTHTPQQ